METYTADQILETAARVRAVVTGPMTLGAIYRALGVTTRYGRGRVSRAVEFLGETGYIARRGRLMLICPIAAGQALA